MLTEEEQKKYESYNNLLAKVEAGEAELSEPALNVVKQTISDLQLKAATPSVGEVGDRDTLGGVLNNMVNSFGGAAMDVVQGVVNLPNFLNQSASDMRNAAGSFLGMVPEKQGNYIWQDIWDNEVTRADARYGGEQIADTLAIDPFGSMLDASIIGTGLKGLAKAGQMGRRSGGLIETVGNRLERLDPYSIAVDGVIRPTYNAFDPRSVGDQYASQYDLTGLPREIDNPQGRANFVERIIELGGEPNKQGAATLKAKADEVGTELNRVVDEVDRAEQERVLLDGEEPVFTREEMEQTLRDRQKEESLPRDVPVPLAERQGSKAVIEDYIGQIPPDIDHYGPRYLQDTKVEWDKRTDHDAAPASAESGGKVGAKIISNTARKWLNSWPEIKPLNEEYSELIDAAQRTDAGVKQRSRTDTTILDRGAMRLAREAVPAMFTGQWSSQRAPYLERLQNGSFFDAYFNAANSTNWGRARRMSVVGDPEHRERDIYIYPNGRELGYIEETF